MKKIFYVIAAAAALVVACNKNEEGKKDDKVAVTGVSLNKTEIVFTEGENKTETLVATITPENATNKNVTWTTSNDKVAAVADGKVTPGAKGEATITVTTEDGGKTATCKVTVNENKKVAVESVTLDCDILEVGISLIPTTLVATVLPAEAEQTVIWSSSDESIAVVDNGDVYALAVGVATITATSIEDATKSATCEVRVSAAKIALDESMVECNAPMEFVSFNQNCTETGDHCYGLDGSPDWFMPLTEAMATARGTYLSEPEYMFDEDEATCYHTNLDWGVPYTSWGCREEEINYGQHYIQINFDSPLSNLGISVVACTDEAVNHGFGEDAALIVKYTTDGEAFTVSGQYPWSYTARIEDKINVGEDNAEYAQDIIAIRFQTNIADNWTHTETAFGIAELAVTAN